MQQRRQENQQQELLDGYFVQLVLQHVLEVKHVYPHPQVTEEMVLLPWKI
jgi:hypothetical protein